MQIQAKKLFRSSIKDASLLRRFTILFILMSVLPITVIYYFYTQIKIYGTFQITKLFSLSINRAVFEITDFQLAFIFTIFGVVVGYFNMRQIIKQLIDLTEANRRVLENVLSTDKIKELSGEKNELALLAQSFSAITERLEENVRSLELAKRTLHTVMSKVGQGISSMRNIDNFLQLILETVTDALGGKVGTLLLLNGQPDELHVKSVFGLKDAHQGDITIPFGKGTAFDLLMKDRKPLVMTRFSSEISIPKEHSYLFEPPVLCSPLVLHDKVIGVLTIAGRANGGFEADEMSLLFNLSTQTAVAIENSKLSTDIEETYFETISALALAVDAKDKYSRGHLDRVANYCVRIAQKMELSPSDIKTLRDAARLHDIGKIGIPDEVLGKQGPLNDQEWHLMKKHPEIGESILKPIRSLVHLCDIIRHHHEKLDGTGYPDRLQGNEISLLVRITTVADIYDALTTDRSYRKRMSSEDASAELRKMTTWVDQRIVEIFLETLKENTASV
jgi:HD-GYP domain-containing protein (c-di-GMP phosphodiesterase class II)